MIRTHAFHLIASRLREAALLLSASCAAIQAPTDIAEETAHAQRTATPPPSVSLIVGRMDLGAEIDRSGQPDAAGFEFTFGSLDTGVSLELGFLRGETSGIIRSDDGSAISGDIDVTECYLGLRKTLQADWWSGYVGAGGSFANLDPTGGVSLPGGIPNDAVSDQGDSKLGAYVQAGKRVSSARGVHIGLLARTRASSDFSILGEDKDATITTFAVQVGVSR